MSNQDRAEGVIPKLRCLTVLLQQLNAREANVAVNDAIELLEAQPRDTPGGDIDTRVERALAEIGDFQFCPKLSERKAAMRAALIAADTTPQAPGADTPGGRGEGEPVTEAQVLRACSAYDVAAMLDGETGMESAQYVWMHAALTAARLNTWNNATVHGWRMVDEMTVFSITPPSGAFPPQEFIRYDDFLKAHPAESSGGDAVDADKARMDWLESFIAAPHIELQEWYRLGGTERFVQVLGDDDEVLASESTLRAAIDAAIASGAEHGR